jgi:hypothetical protein
VFRWLERKQFVQSLFVFRAPDKQLTWCFHPNIYLSPPRPCLVARPRYCGAPSLRWLNMTGCANTFQPLGCTAGQTSPGPLRERETGGASRYNQNPACGLRALTLNRQSVLVSKNCADSSDSALKPRRRHNMCSGMLNSKQALFF